MPIGHVIKAGARIFGCSRKTAWKLPRRGPPRPRPAWSAAAGSRRAGMSFGRGYACLAPIFSKGCVLGHLSAMRTPWCAQRTAFVSTVCTSGW